MDEKIIQELVSGYGLMDTLQDRLQVVVKDGVARSTIYKAFQEGGITPRTRTVLRIAEEIILEHEEAVKNAVAVFATETA